MMAENLFLYIGILFLFVAAVEYLSGVALHSTIFSSFTGTHTIVTRRKEPEKFRTAIMFHSIAGIFFSLINFMFG
jgi:hypothetical protein